MGVPAHFSINIRLFDYFEKKNGKFHFKIFSINIRLFDYFEKKMENSILKFFRLISDFSIISKN